MWRRVRGLMGPTTMSWLAFVACGKSEHRLSDEGGGAGVSTAGVTSAAGKGSAGSGASGGGEASGGSAQAGNAVGGNAQAGNVMGGNAVGGSVPVGEGGLVSGGETGTAGEAGAGGAPACGSYQACGCGCCPGSLTVTTCVYPSLGQDLQQIIDEDVARRKDAAGCANVGCSAPHDYVCCEGKPPKDDGATYEATATIGGYDRIHLNKTAGLQCSTFSLVNPKSAGTQFPVETPASWAVESVTRLECTSSMTQHRAIGALGTLSLRVVGSACVLDAHLTAFFGSAAEGVTAESFEAQDVPINISIQECH